MRPLQVTVRNVRGARDVRLNLRPFSALVGPNNAGKTTLLDAVRLFYGSLAWDPVRDRPWDVPADEPSWIEIVYEMSQDEAAAFFFPQVDPSDVDVAEGVTGLGLLDNGTLRIRRYFTGNHPGEYRYVSPGGDEEATGWDDATGSLGVCVYVPTLAQLRDQTSVATDSPLREVLLLAFSQSKIDGLLMGVRGALSVLQTALSDGPIADLENELDEALHPWGLSAEVGVGTLSADFIVQNLIELQVKQEGTRRAMEAQGSGVQRALVAALIQAAARVRAKAEENDFRWVLFEEPEAFLHPAQVTRLAQDLRRLTESGNATVTITTHDPTTLAASETSPEGITRVQRRGSAVEAVSPEPETVRQALDDIHVRSAYIGSSSGCFQKVPAPRPEEQRRRRVLYDLDARRAAAFFADRVIIVEGFSDVVFFEWLERQGYMAAVGPNVGFLDAGGKFDLHRAARTLSLFGIPHVVVWDEDAAMAVQGTDGYRTKHCRDSAVMETLCAAAHDPGSAFAGAVRLPGTIERWLGIKEEGVGAWKAANVGGALASSGPGAPALRRAEALVELIRDLFDGADPDEHRKKPEFDQAMIRLDLPEPSRDLAAFPPQPRCVCLGAAR
ncbi:ATP-dependent nuclease [Spirillospora albida]|uniref:ATP-dependent nuclease n=1 Tax=Spirillospora albida TaxID=58123 RepID=UPI0004C08DBD|nr:ATP-binding protein [Spirillospora albida]